MSNFDSRHSKKTRFLKVFIVRKKKIEFGSNPSNKSFKKTSFVGNEVLVFLIKQ